MNTLRKADQQALEALTNNKRTHYYCEDSWYSCPKHKEGCANEAEGDDCNCGADKANAEIEKAIAALKTALQEPVEGPVAYIHRQGNHWEVSERPLADDEKARGWTEEPLYTAPHQRNLLAEEEKQDEALLRQALEQLKINRTNFRKGPSKSISKMLASGNDEIIEKLQNRLDNGN